MSTYIPARMSVHMSAHMSMDMSTPSWAVSSGLCPTSSHRACTEHPTAHVTDYSMERAMEHSMERSNGDFEPALQQEPRCPRRTTRTSVGASSSFVPGSTPYPSEFALYQLAFGAEIGSISACVGQSCLNRTEPPQQQTHMPSAGP